MMNVLSLEFLVAILFIIDLLIIFLLILFVKRVNRIRMDGDPGQIDTESITAAAFDASSAAALEAGKEVRDMLSPLVEASRTAASEFEQLIHEKKKISKDLNDALDSKIISINLLLSRASALQNNLEEQQHRNSRPLPVRSDQPSVAPRILDQQNRIIDLYYQKVDIDTIAEQLSIPKGEVQLVIDLKEKFVAMEQA